MARITEAEVKEAAAITTPDAFNAWFKSYFERAFSKGRVTRVAGEDMAMFLIAQHPEWIPLVLNLAVPYLKQVNDARAFGSSIWGLVASPISNAVRDYGLRDAKAKSGARASKAYVQLLINKINQFGWNPDTFRNALSLLGIGVTTVQKRPETKKTGWFLWKKTVTEEVEERVARSREEILAELQALL